jgi:hypothetical protein
VARDHHTLTWIRPAHAAACVSCPFRLCGQHLLLVGSTAHLAWWASRIAPAWYERQMARRLRGELAADGGG